MTNDLNPALTPEQRQLAQSYHNIIHRFLHRNGLKMDAVEDWYGVAAIGLCKAAKVSSCNIIIPFPLLAYLYIENEVHPISVDFEVYPPAVCGAASIAYRSLEQRKRDIIKKIVNEDISFTEIARQTGFTSDEIAITYKQFLEDVKYFLW